MDRDILQRDSEHTATELWDTIRGMQSACTYCFLISTAIEESWPLSGQAGPYSDERIFWDSSGPLPPLKKRSFRLGPVHFFHKHESRLNINDTQPQVVIAESELPNGTVVRGYIRQVCEEDDVRRGAHQHIHGRTVDHLAVEFKLLRRWLETCRQVHGEYCNASALQHARLPLNFRVINVNMRRVEQPDRTESFEYVALSYVWGERRMARPMSKTQKASISVGAGGSATIQLPVWLPQTIEDAIRVTQELGFDYLWVDSLCIIQDDEEDVKQQMVAMGAVYNCAALTIIAAAGNYADYGLCGVSRPRERAQAKALIGGAFYIPERMLESSLEARPCEWASRCWTLQEAFLSRRELYFTDAQVYLRCVNGIFKEDSARENVVEASRRTWASRFAMTTARPEDLEFMLLPDNRSFFHQYTTIIEDYTTRSVTVASDQLNAVSGILHTIAPHGCEYFSGLPSIFFHLALLWIPRQRTRHVMREDFPLPSWSWAAWSFFRSGEFYQTKKSGCSWWYNNDLKATWVRRINDEQWPHAWPPIDVVKVVEVQTGQKRVCCRVQGPLVSRIDVSISPAEGKSLDALGSIFYIETRVAVFAIGFAIPFWSRDDPDRIITYELRSQGRVVGEVWLTRRARNRQPRRCECLDLCYGRGQTVEVDRSRDFATCDLPDDRPLLTRQNRAIIRNVLIIERHGAIARRVGIGRVLTAAFDEAVIRHERICVA